MVDVHARYIRSLEQDGRAEPRARVPADRRGLRRAPGGRRRAHRPRVRGPALAHEDRARRRSCSPPTCPTTRALANELERYFPTPLRERFRGAAAAPPAAARDHRHARRQRPRQPRRHDLRVPAAATRPAPAPPTSRAPTRPRARSSSCATSGPRSRRSTGRSPPRRRSRCCSRRGSCSSGRRAGSCATGAGRSTSRRRSPASRRARRRSPRPCPSCSARPSVEAARVTGVARRRPACRPRSRSGSRISRRSCRRSTSSRSRRRGLDVVSVADVYFSLGARLELHWLRDRIVALSRDTRWEAMARAALRDDVYSEQAALTASLAALRVGSGVERGWPRTRARRAHAAAARGHQDRRRARSRPALGRGARDPQPDPLERLARAGAAARVAAVDATARAGFGESGGEGVGEPVVLGFEALVRELEPLDSQPRCRARPAAVFELAGQASRKPQRWTGLRASSSSTIATFRLDGRRRVRTSTNRTAPSDPRRLA